MARFAVPIIYIDKPVGKGLLRTVTDPRAKTTTYDYDDKGNLTLVDPPSLGDTRLTPDALSRVTRVVDGKNQITNYSYDDLDRVETVGFDDSSSTTYDYDGDGNMVARTDDDGAGGSETTTFAYDALNRMTERSAPGRPLVTYDYDAASNLTEISHGSERVGYSFDDVNLVATMTEPGDRVTHFEHNPNYRRSLTRSPSGVEQRVTYEQGKGRVTDIKATPPGGGAPLVHLTYNYTVSDGLVSYESPLRQSVTDVRTGETTDYDYDAQNRLRDASVESSSGAEIDAFTYTYDPASNIKTSKRLGEAERTYSYGDGNELLERQVSGGATTTYQNDANGNLTGNSAGLALSYNARNQTTSITPAGGGAFAMSYAGVTSDERLTAGSASFTYDLLGVGVESDGGDTFYGRDPEGKLVSMRMGAERFNYITDALGSVVALTNESGSVAARYDYAPYGELIDSSGTVDNPWRFASGYFDEETDLYKFGTRYYDPSLGRWTQQDPVKGSITNPITLNPYLYSGQDPINNSDPTGRFFDISWESVGEFVATQVLGTLVGGSFAAACWGVAAYFSAGTALTVATYGCYGAGRAIGSWVASEARQQM